MSQLRVAVVSRDEHIRLEAGRAFDSAPAHWVVGLYKERPADADVVVFGSDVGGAEGPVFDPSRPEGVLEAVQAAAEARGVGRVVAVTSCNGGAGVTSVALHLARALAARREVCYLDLDTQWSVGGRLGLEAGALPTWADLEEDPETVRRCALPVEQGFRILLAPTGGGVEEATDVARRAAAHFELVIVDLPWSPAVLGVLGLARAGVLVLPPSRPACLRARALLEESDGLDWAAVTNRLGRGSELRRAEIERLIDRPVALALPHAPPLRDAEDEGRLLSSGLWRWSRRVEGLAAALERALWR